MNHSVNKIKYEDFLKFLPQSFVEQLNEYEIEEKTIRLIFSHPLFFLYSGIECLSVSEHIFPISLQREGYLSVENKDFKLDAVVTNKELEQFYKIFQVSILDYGFSIDPVLGLMKMLNDSSIELNVSHVDKLQPEIRFSGFFKGYGYDFTSAEQHECLVETRIYGVKNKDLENLQPWKLKLIDAFIIYGHNDYETVIQRLHSAFEMFLKSEYVSLFHVEVPRVTFNSLFDQVLIKKRLKNVKTIKNQNKIYSQIKLQRDNNMHKMDEKIRKQIAEAFTYIVVTFIYSISFGKNMFDNPWISGIESRVVFD